MENNAEHYEQEALRCLRRAVDDRVAPTSEDANDYVKHAHVYAMLAVAASGEKVT